MLGRGYFHFKADGERVTVGRASFISKEEAGGKLQGASPTSFSQSSALNQQKTVDSPQSLLPVEVVRVIDGDTAVFRINNTEETFRFLGINAPETVHPELSPECYGPGASEVAKSVLGEETAVYLELDELTGERDKYGRLLAHIWLEDGTLRNT